MIPEIQRLLYLKIRDVNQLSQKNFSLFLENEGITPVQFGVLQSLSTSDSMTMTKLYKLVGCVPSNMTTLINRMERDGFVVTTKNRDDQRQTLVFLTEKGKELKNSVIRLYQQFLEENYRSLSLEEQETLLRLLLIVEEDLNKNR